MQWYRWNQSHQISYAKLYKTKASDFDTFLYNDTFERERMIFKFEVPFFFYNYTPENNVQQQAHASRTY